MLLLDSLEVITVVWGGPLAMAVITRLPASFLVRRALVLRCAMLILSLPHGIIVV